MGGVGFTEMVLLAVIALIVIGPDKLPKIARTAGQLSRQARNAWQGLQTQLQAELDAEHNREIMNAMNSLNTATNDIQEKTEAIHTSINETDASIKEVYSIGSTVDKEMDELDREMREIETLIEKVNQLNSENSKSITQLNTEMEKFEVTLGEEGACSIDELVELEAAAESAE